MELLLLIIFGAIAGWMASIVMRTDNALMWEVLLGITGAVLGGFIMALFGTPPATGLNLYSLFVAILGASVLIWIGRRLQIGYR